MSIRRDYKPASTWQRRRQSARRHGLLVVTLVLVGLFGGLLAYIKGDRTLHPAVSTAAPSQPRHRPAAPLHPNRRPPPLKSYPRRSSLNTIFTPNCPSDRSTFNRTLPVRVVSRTHRPPTRGRRPRRCANQRHRRQTGWRRP